MDTLARPAGVGQECPTYKFKALVMGEGTDRRHKRQALGPAIYNVDIGLEIGSKQLKTLLDFRPSAATML